ncbi:MAG: type VI secretion system baseplate subunit TssF [Myxococcota bacterium]|nr:type VI secretion system baseplate subunit TssF [Myxococcota bacterium]
MKLDDNLYQAFLSELETLEKFRITYSGMHPLANIDRDDQDVQRMVEAFAVFSARSRLAGERSVNRQTLRMFLQHFPYLLSPVPAMTMLKATPTMRFVDATDLPSNTEATLAVPKPPQPGAPISYETFSFRTLYPIRILPIELKQVRLESRRQEGYRLSMEFSSSFPRNDDVRELNLLVNHLNDFMSSLLVYSELQNTLVGATIQFDERSENPDPGSCRVSFGPPSNNVLQKPEFELNAVERVRMAFHYPHQELFLRVSVPKTPRNWKGFTIRFDLSRQWPTDLKLTKETFQLSATPLINIKKQMANPIVCDGTKERYAVKSPNFSDGYRLHSILGVYQNSDEGMTPIFSEAISASGDSYFAEIDGENETRRAFLHLDMQRALLEPVTVAVEARWVQPAVGHGNILESSITLPDRFIEGVEWKRVGTIEPCRESPLNDKIESLLHIVALKSQRFLNHDDMIFLLSALGADQHRMFRRILGTIESTKIEQVPYARQSNGTKQVYQISLKGLEANLLPAAHLFFAKVLELLQAWSIEEVVEVLVDIPNLERRLTFSRVS